MDKFIQKSNNIIDSDYIITNIIHLDKDNIVLSNINLNNEELNSNLANVECSISNTTDQMLVDVRMKQDILLDRLNYTCTHKDNIALANILNIIYYINNNQNNKKLLLEYFNYFINNIPKNKNIINNSAQFLNNFRYFSKYVDNETRQSIKNYITKNNINNDKILNNMIEIMNNKCKLTNSNWTFVFSNIFQDNLYGINLIDNKILINILRDNIPEEYKFNILENIMQVLVQDIHHLSKTSNKKK